MKRIRSEHIGERSDKRSLHFNGSQRYHGREAVEFHLVYLNSLRRLFKLIAGEMTSLVVH